MAKFKKGQSGNPAGKPAGTPSKTTKLRALLEPHANELVAKAVALAKAGDTVALRLCLERLIPAFKAEGAPVAVEALAGPGTLTEQGRRTIAEMAAGRLSPEDAAAVMQAISALVRVEEMDELRRRVEALESKRPAGQR